ncbi:MAG: sulfatase-like hydrolase/transferase [Myxococcota bacterium]
MKRAAILAAVLLPIAAAVLWEFAPGLDLALARLAGRASPSAPTTILVVIDTLRADRTSLCGYGKPTTPALQRFASEGATFTCGARTPGSWTLPSHASFFTGLPVLEHGAHELVSGGLTPEATAERVRPLPKGVPTLAEAMAARGHQAHAVSANPVVSGATGLARGFDTAVAAASFGELRGEALIDEVERALRQRADERPLFLFVNVADAHPPFETIPASLGFLPPTKRLLYEPHRKKGNWRRFYAGTHRNAEKFLADVGHLYDYGVWRADRTVAALVDRVEATGWCDRGCRWVVVSDHGEFLGEKGLVDHGHYLWEPDTRVPMMVWEKGTGASAPALPPLVNALHAYHLAKDGALPAELAPVVSVTWPHERRCANTRKKFYCETSAALWEGDDKLLWTDGRFARYDLAADPAEERPLPLDPDARARLDALAAAVVAARSGSDAMDPELLEALEAAGYLE